MAEAKNLLASETSPYLRQHKDNPVHWRPWGEAALAEARERDVPIFLSVGYSTCYWCHVMERESFEDDATAAVMNEHFVCIKVDREERPDVDALYMTAVQIQTQQGGWPMNVFLLPDGRYFYGGTYFPKDDMQGRPGFVRVLRGIADAYANERRQVEEQAEQITEILRRLAEPDGPERAITCDMETVEALERASRGDFEPRHGGFGSAPKFPRQTLLSLSLKLQRERPDADRERQLRQTLDAMASGGIRDHLGGGFHRYSTDAKWLVPHFEIMLYDQAMLLSVYADAAELFGDEGYRAVARRLADFVLREMASDSGAFFTAFDAEVNAREGQNYLWTDAEVREVLGDDAEAFMDAYGMTGGPNFADPHHDQGVPRASILHTSGGFREAEERFADQREKLKAVRDRREQPLLDDKILTSWNALMIRGLVRASAVLDEPKYHDSAARAADWLLQNHRDDDGLLRTGRHRALLEDYAYLAAALLDVGGEERVKAARDLVAEMNASFGDPGRAPFFSPADADDLVVRQKSGTDSPQPAAAAVAGEVMQRLGDIDGAAGVVESFAGLLAQQPGGMSALLELALDLALAEAPVHVEPREGNRPPTPEALAEAAVQVAGQWTSDRSLQLTLAIAPGHHLQGTTPIEGLVGTTLAATGRTDVNVALPADGELRGTINATLTFAEDMTPVDRLDLALRYQACTEDACLPPVSRTLTVRGPATKTTACAPDGCGDSNCACTQE